MLKVNITGNDLVNFRPSSKKWLTPLLSLEELIASKSSDYTLEAIWASEKKEGKEETQKKKIKGALKIDMGRVPLKDGEEFSHEELDKIFDSKIAAVEDAVLTCQAEKGVDTLFITFGMITWRNKEGDLKKEYNAPVILIPCSLKESADGIWNLTTESKEEWQINPMLNFITKDTALKRVKEEERFDLDRMVSYLQELEEHFKTTETTWKFQKEECHLGSFNYTGVPLEECDPKQFGLMANSLEELFLSKAHNSGSHEEGVVNDDPVLDPILGHTPLPADSSQLAVILDVAMGKSLVVQGPPGSGKSQVIVNLIANQISKGKKVLFLAQKNEALEVVTRRLSSIGLEPLLLKLNPSKDGGGRRSFYEQIQTRKEAGNKTTEDNGLKEDKISHFQKAREELKEYGDFLQDLSGPYPHYEAMGKIILVKASFGEDVETSPPPSSPSSPSSSTPPLKVLPTLPTLFLVLSLEKIKLQKIHDIAQRCQELFEESNIKDISHWQRVPYSLLKIDESEALNTLKLGTKALKKLSSLDEKYFGENLKDFQSLLNHDIEKFEKNEENKRIVKETNEKKVLFLEKFGIEANDSTLNYLRELKSLSWFSKLFSQNWKEWKKAHGTESTNELSSAFSTCREIVNNQTIEVLDLPDFQREVRADILKAATATFELLNVDILTASGKESLSYFSQRWMELPAILSIKKDIKELAELLSLGEEEVPLELCYDLSKIIERSLLTVLEEEVRRKANDIETPKTTARGFRKLNKEVESLTRIPVSPIPSAPRGTSGVSVKDKTGLSLLHHVANTPGARIPIRHFIKKTKDELLNHMPCWVATPSYLSNYVERTPEMFDLLIVDEASQIFKEDAAGAMMRSKQFVIFGDSQQLPPTNVATSALYDHGDAGEDNEKEDSLEEESFSKDVKSLLDFACLHLKERSLTYHYRSKHHSLIEFSNEKFYKGELMLPPEPNLDKDSFAIELIELNKKESVTSFYKDSKNLREVEEVKNQLLRHISKYQGDDFRSVLIGTMNKQQSGEISKQLRIWKTEHPEIREFAQECQKRKEELTVKNLESIQGDERDTVIISTVFGPSKDELKVNQNFGINKAGEERRINVLITRARKNIVVITSLRDGDITIESRGPQILKEYLFFAKNRAFLLPKQKTGEYDSPWEEFFHKKLQSDGFIVDTQVGVGKWRIDLGIRGKDKDLNRYICGIELDGAAYHSSQVARERDSLREEILENKGWKILRVWSTDFFKRPEAEYQLLVSKIEGILKRYDGVS
jgi:very-short-patch-repair endonuclease/RecA/RadA recombinase